MKTIHFISGMPRSGSTLLCNILAQNPRLHCTHTSGCMDVMFGVRNQWDKLVEHQAHPDDECKLRVLRGILEAYYETCPKPVILEKCRGWVSQLEMAEAVLDRKAKVLVPVRSVAEVVASMERLHRKTAAIRQPPGEAENYFQMQTVQGRAEAWLAPGAVVGLALNRIRDAIARGFCDRLHFVSFEQLTASPRTTLESIYAFLDEPPYRHDFERVEQVTTEDDGVHGYVGLHDIRTSVLPVEPRAETVLGPELARRLNSIPIPWREVPPCFPVPLSALPRSRPQPERSPSASSP